MHWTLFRSSFWFRNFNNFFKEFSCTIKQKTTTKIKRKKLRKKSESCKSGEDHISIGWINLTLLIANWLYLKLFSLSFCFGNLENLRGLSICRMAKSWHSPTLGFFLAADWLQISKQGPVVRKGTHSLWFIQVVKINIYEQLYIYVCKEVSFFWYTYHNIMIWNLIQSELEGRVNWASEGWRWWWGGGWRWGEFLPTFSPPWTFSCSCITSSWSTLHI